MTVYGSGFGFAIVWMLISCGILYFIVKVAVRNGIIEAHSVIKDNDDRK